MLVKLASHGRRLGASGRSTGSVHWLRGRRMGADVHPGQSAGKSRIAATERKGRLGVGAAPACGNYLRLGGGPLSQGSGFDFDDGDSVLGQHGQSPFTRFDIYKCRHADALCQCADEGAKRPRQGGAQLSDRVSPGGAGIQDSADLGVLPSAGLACGSSGPFSCRVRGAAFLCPESHARSALFLDKETHRLDT